ncbi:hypothetical protein C8R44DRAFT_846558 [Mycena epipterygia]|nr:hypothetical protein C8R44DRAFT_846558 [Mycena epipterygia]
MLFNAIISGLLALSFVHASPAPPTKPILPSTIDLLRQNPVSVTLINVAVNVSAFTFAPFDGQDLEVLVGQPLPEQEYYPVWNRFKVGGDQYIFNNLGTGYWLTVNPANKHLVADVVPTIFAVESVGGKDFVIKLPNADMVAEAIYDGTSMIYGRVALRPASGSTYQHWRFV